MNPRNLILLKKSIAFLLIGTLILLNGSLTAFAAHGSEQQLLIASDESTNAQFGSSVAIDGEYAVIGAIHNGAVYEGAAYVFLRGETSWSEQQKITVTSSTGEDFGYSVDISGATIVVGDPLDDTPGTNSGTAYVFTRSGTTWTEQQELIASGLAHDDWIGVSVAISGDTIVVGAPDDDTPVTNSGAAYVFTRSGSTWTEQQKLKAGDMGNSDLFGYSVDIDGDSIIVGAAYNNAFVGAEGSAYIFTRSGSTWTQQQKLKASDGETGGRFGISVAIDGDNVIVGSDRKNEGYGQDGVAYIFTRSGTTWTQQQKIMPSVSSWHKRFGSTVGIFGDNAIGGSPDTNQAYIFLRVGTDWTEDQTITGSGSEPGAYFGSSVAINGDYPLIGAPLEDNSVDAGSAYVFLAPAIGGVGGGVPEFSTYMYIAVLLLAIGLMCNRYGERSPIKAKS